MTSSRLERLVQGYLHQDWLDDYDSAWAAVDAFLEDEGPDAGGALAAEVTAILNAGHSETELRRLILDEFGSGYSPPGDGLTFEAWLRELAERAA